MPRYCSVSRDASRMKRFDNSIFERVKTDDAQTSALAHHSDRLREHGLELLEFAVDRDANCLERFGRRMILLAALWALPLQLCEPAAPCARSALPCARDNRASDASLRCFPHRIFASTCFNSRSSTDASHSLADVPESGSIRISSGPSRMKLKPRSASSSCGEETPRSKSRPSTFPTSPLSPMIVSSCAHSPLPVRNADRQ